MQRQVNGVRSSPRVTGGSCSGGSREQVLGSADDRQAWSGVAACSGRAFRRPAVGWAVGVGVGRGPRPTTRCPWGCAPGHPRPARRGAPARLPADPGHRRAQPWGVDPESRRGLPRAVGAAGRGPHRRGEGRGASRVLPDRVRAGLRGGALGGDRGRLRRVQPGAGRRGRGPAPPDDGRGRCRHAGDRRRRGRPGSPDPEPGPARSSSRCLPPTTRRAEWSRGPVCGHPIRTATRR